ncbi:Cdc6-like AAA superfamily ATPase [Halarchaeum rubridurum]|uniref:ATP-binding protein n=1 Tax=Halarchaeum rubridurum TaxID=489911 RepID=A0A830FVG8_9EURY|nr:AAA family ATPase [Halarchaeum rubridurum]MBP1953349.1 Cdc6-like AAA superfamily ATPase [Halarchaeum rubridurum]GGM65999.1 ATP-binding protein [Halarchaeum rubridurum]
MDIDARIRRRRHRADSQRLVREYGALSPVAHVEDPAGRGPVVERLLDHLDPVFDGRLPRNAYVHGPFGAGKTAVVTALFARLDDLSVQSQSAIHTSTRATASTEPRFVYVDLRETASEFAFYRHVLDAVVDETVPEHGVGTDEIRTRLHDALARSPGGAVVAVDHVGSPRVDTTAVRERLDGLPDSARWLAIGRLDPAACPFDTAAADVVHIDAYRRRVLIDVLMTRANAGLAQGALDHALASQIADWAEGNAHDALAALFAAAERAADADATRLREADVEAACTSVPRPAVSLGEVLALSANKQRVLRALVDLDGDGRCSVTETAEGIAAAGDITLSTGTIERYLYELAEAGVLERVRVTDGGGKGRSPSRVELRFPPTVFRRLYDLRR